MDFNAILSNQNSLYFVLYGSEGGGGIKLTKNSIIITITTVTENSWYIKYYTCVCIVDYEAWIVCNIVIKCRWRKSVNMKSLSLH